MPSIVSVPDRLDHKLLKVIEENPGFTVIEVIRPFLDEKSQRALRDRIQYLVRHKLVRLEKERHVVRCFPMGGKEEA